MRESKIDLLLKNFRVHMLINDKKSGPPGFQSYTMKGIQIKCIEQIIYENRPGRFSAVCVASLGALHFKSIDAPRLAMTT